MKNETNPPRVSMSTSKPKNPIKPEITKSRISSVSSQKGRVVNKPVSKPKSEVVVEAQKGRIVNRLTREGLVRKKVEVEMDGKKELVEKEGLIRKLEMDLMELKGELDRVKELNVELGLNNGKLAKDLADAQAKIIDLTKGDKVTSVGEYQSPQFRDIQKLIANKLEHPKFKTEAINDTKSPSVLSSTYVQRKTQEVRSAPPPPPPPLPPSRPPARAATIAKPSLPKHNGNKDMVRGNYNKPIVTSAHNSIVGEIQNRSSHLLAIKSDIETKGELINGLIDKILTAAYTDIEDVLSFVDWLDKELSSLADERAVLKHFNWPEKKADAMREAAIEYRSLKLLEREVSSYKDDVQTPCILALKKMTGLLDKSERSIQRLIKLRNSVMRSYRDYQIPTDWMLDSGIVKKIKQASKMLANVYMKRVTYELESSRCSEKESTQEALLLQGMQFAHRAHQFGGLDAETLCTFEEMRQRVPGHLQRSKELFARIP